MLKQPVLLCLWGNEVFRGLTRGSRLVPRSTIPHRDFPPQNSPFAVPDLIEFRPEFHVPVGALGKQLIAAANSPPPVCLESQTTVFAAFGAGPRGMAESYGVPFLGSIPMDPNLLKACEEGEAFTTEYADSPAAKPFGSIVAAVVDATPDTED